MRSQDNGVKYSSAGRWFVASAVLGASVIAAGSMGPSVATASSGTVAGTVFQDFASDGEFDVAEVSGEATDLGVAGVQVRAFDSAGVQVGSATSGASGAYSLSVTGAATDQVRIEFAIPSTPALAGYQPSFAFSSTGASGSSGGTSVQFAELGDTDVNFGINLPEDYCQNNPNIAVSRQCAGSTSAVLAAPTVWVSHFDGGPFHDSTTRLTQWSSTRAASTSETGSILGMAWNPISGRVIHSAYVRRSALMYESPTGTPLPGALFSTNPDATDSSGAGGTTSFLVNLEALMGGDQFSNTTVPASGVADAGYTGYVPSNAARNIGNSASTDSDIPAGSDGVFEEVGKVGIGDIDVDADGNLYVVSLYTRELYKVPLPSNGGAPTSMSSIGSIVSDVSCTNGDARPFGLEIRRGVVYMGVVCDASADYSGADPTSTTDDRNLTFTIVSYDTADDSWGITTGPVNLFAAASGAPTKGYVFDPDIDTSAPADQTQWNPWTDTFDEPMFYHPSPMLSDIEFDVDGSIILGFRDRWADQWGRDYGKDPAGGSSVLMMMGGGDLKRICNTGGGYVFEGGAGCAPKGNNNTGTLGSSLTSDDEWYFGDRFATLHQETITGMTEFVPGFIEVLASAFDPWNETNSAYVDSGGVAWFDNTSGDQGGPNGKGVMYYDKTVQSDGMFGKANGVSDIEALCDLAPLQIGNRVWLDDDLDGIQDPGESGVAGVTVRLYGAGGVLAGTAVTNVSGEYLFSSNNSEAANGGSSPDSFGGGLDTGAAFTVALDRATDYSTGPLTALALTVENAATSVSTDVDNSIDSDAVADPAGTFGVDSFPEISVAAHGSGANDHSFDFGMAPSVSVQGRVWCDADRDGTKGSTEEAVSAVTLTIATAAGGAVTDVTGASVSGTTSGSDGAYSFDSLPTDSYTVTITVPSGYTLEPPATTAASTGALSTAGAVATLDFSVCATAVSVGDFVWYDSDANGIQDPGEPGIGGVTLTITNVDGSAVQSSSAGRARSKAVVQPVTTNAYGIYKFEGLRPGQYRVVVETPAGMKPTKAGVGDATKDSSESPALWRELSGGEEDLGLDFGFIDLPKPPGKPVSIGDFVWRDRNGDGFQARHEKGFAGATVRVYDVSGKPARHVSGALVKAQVTGKTGRYRFTNLPAGRYSVRVTYPRGFRPTTSGFPDRHKDSSTYVARSVNVSAGSSDLSLDFGVVGDWRGLANTR